MVFCFEITFKIVKMRSISAVDFFSYEFINSVPTMKNLQRLQIIPSKCNNTLLLLHSLGHMPAKFQPDRIRDSQNMGGAREK